jgi:hypothetical protein
MEKRIAGSYGKHGNYGRWFVRAIILCRSLAICACESGGGPPRSRTLRARRVIGIRASVLECASPLALFSADSAAERSLRTATTLPAYCDSDTSVAVHFSHRLFTPLQRSHVTKSLKIPPNFPLSVTLKRAEARAPLAAVVSIEPLWRLTA